jgi:hypothetical protein
MLQNVTRVFVSATIIALMSASGCAGATAPQKTLQAFASDQALTDLFRRWAEEHRLRQAAERTKAGAERRMQAQSSFLAASPRPAAMAKAAENAVAGAADSVTNVQHAGVDEGGIVKLHGDHLVILRRSRLFTVKVHDRELTPVTTTDAFGAGIDPRGAWYDEMLITGNTIAVIGYSYARGGTEIGLFEIDGAGGLRYRSTYHLRSNDYYSSRNYASRLIGSKLIFYTPLRLNPWDPNPCASFPALRRWQPGVTASDFKRIAPATRIYRTDEELDPYQGVALHTVAVCDLAKPDLDCTSTAVLGPPGRVFYVSGSSVFVWTTASRGQGAVRAEVSAVFRLPLDGSAPTALKTTGSPIDQFSFLEGEDGFLNVLVRSNGRGDGMWAAERNAGQLALLRVSLSSFSDGKDSAARSAYRALPTPRGGTLQNRYVGSYLIYGSGTGWRRPHTIANLQAYAVRYAIDTGPQELALGHGVDRIEALDKNAVVIGTDGRDLHFTSLRLGRRAETADRYIRANAAQGETRSHGFYYRQYDEDEGLVGLPIIDGDEAASSQLRKESASLLYLRNRGLKLRELGTLDSRADVGATNDACRASCVDWYGNSRPLFVKNRVFALLGYEIVEGVVSGASMIETRRISFAPHWVDALP